jgi:hypothetical protein
MRPERYNYRAQMPHTIIITILWTFKLVIVCPVPDTKTLSGRAEGWFDMCDFGQVAEHVHDSGTEIMEGPDRRRAKGRCIGEIRKRIGRRSVIMKWWQFPRETDRQIFL